MTKKEETKQHIIHTVIQCIRDGETYDQLSMRHISKVANVSLGLINYHFESKDTLLISAAEMLLAEAVAKCQSILNSKGVEPADRLIKFILNLTEVFYENKTLTKLYLTSSFNKGSLQNSLFILPVLMEIFPKNDEQTLKLQAMQIVLPMQYAFIREDIFNSYIAYDGEMNLEYAKETIEKMVRNIIMS